MAEKLPNRDLVTIDELTLSNAWELEALVEVLTAKGVITKREVLDELAELAAGILVPVRLRVHSPLIHISLTYWSGIFSIYSIQPA